MEKNKPASSLTHPVGEKEKQSYSPVNMSDILPVEGAGTQSHTSSTLESASKKEISAANEPAEDQASGGFGERVSPISVTSAQPSEFIRDEIKPHLERSHPTDNAPGVADFAPAESSADRGIEFSETIDQSLQPWDDRISQSLTSGSIDKKIDLTRYPEAGTSIRFVTPSDETRIQTSDVHGDSRSRSEMNDLVNDRPSREQQPASTTTTTSRRGSRRGTKSSNIIAREEQGMLRDHRKE